MLQCPVDPLKYMELRFIKGRTPPNPAAPRSVLHGRGDVFFSVIYLNAKNHPEVPLGPNKCEKGARITPKWRSPGLQKPCFPVLPEIMIFDTPLSYNLCFSSSWCSKIASKRIQKNCWSRACQKNGSETVPSSFFHESVSK